VAKRDVVYEIDIVRFDDGSVGYLLAKGELLERPEHEDYVAFIQMLDAVKMKLYHEMYRQKYGVCPSRVEETYARQVEALKRKKEEGGR
jgi:hypothetical protein